MNPRRSEREKKGLILRAERRTQRVIFNIPCLLIYIGVIIRGKRASAKMCDRLEPSLGSIVPPTWRIAAIMGTSRTGSVCCSTTTDPSPVVRTTTSDHFDIHPAAGLMETKLNCCLRCHAIYKVCFTPRICQSETVGRSQCDIRCRPDRVLELTEL